MSPILIDLGDRSHCVWELGLTMLPAFYLSLSANDICTMCSFLLPWIYIAQHKIEPKSLPPDTILGLKMYPKCFCGRVSQRSPRPSRWIWGPLRGREGRGTGREGG